jgi:hypothetical protein
MLLGNVCCLKVQEVQFILINVEIHEQYLKKEITMLDAPGTGG